VLAVSTGQEFKFSKSTRTHTQKGRRKGKGKVVPVLNQVPRHEDALIQLSTTP